MIFWYTDNEISQRFADTFREHGIKGRMRDIMLAHIEDFSKSRYITELSGTLRGGAHVFYGIHRGCGNAMRICEYLGADYYYIDNGYFDARYVDDKMVKDLGGTYRVVKNDMIEPYEGACLTKPISHVTFCVLPPSPYTAYFYDTTPEDWIAEQHRLLNSLGHKMFLRDKSAKTSLDEDLDKCDAVLAFNSMAVVRAIELGKAVYTTHGILRNADLIEAYFPYYDIEDIKAFYAGKQYTLDDIGQGKWMN